MTEQNANFYHVVGVEPGCPYKSLRSAFKKRIEEMESRNSTGEEMEKVREAFQCLNDPLSRIEYNRIHGFGYPEGPYSDGESDDEANATQNAQEPTKRNCKIYDSDSDSTSSSSSSSSDNNSTLKEELENLDVLRKKLAEEKEKYTKEHEDLVEQRARVSQSTAQLIEEIRVYNADLAELTARQQELNADRIAYERKKDEFQSQREEVGQNTLQESSEMSAARKELIDLQLEKKKHHHELCELERQKKSFEREKIKQIKRIQEKVAAHFQEKTKSENDLKEERDSLNKLSIQVETAKTDLSNQLKKSEFSISYYKTQKEKLESQEKRNQEKSEYLNGLVKRTEQKSAELDVSIQNVYGHYEATRALLLESAETRVQTFDEKLNTRKEALKFALDKVAKLKQEKSELKKSYDRCDAQLTSANLLVQDIDRKVIELQAGKTEACKKYEELKNRYTSKEVSREQVLEVIRNNDANEVFRFFLGHPTVHKTAPSKEKRNLPGASVVNIQGSRKQLGSVQTRTPPKNVKQVKPPNKTEAIKKAATEQEKEQMSSSSTKTNNHIESKQQPKRKTNQECESSKKRRN